MLLFFCVSVVAVTDATRRSCSWGFQELRVITIRICRNKGFCMHRLFVISSLRASGILHVFEMISSSGAKAFVPPHGCYCL